ncbi:fumarylacetoacetate hydrolase family protein [bacterium]|nr:fumarylacetoacetate hydrolase family protein [bacterium]
MRLCNFRVSGDQRVHAGMLFNGRIYNVSDIVLASSSRSDDQLAERRIGSRTLADFTRLREELEINLANHSDDVASFAAEEVSLEAPVLPVASFRDGYGFEEHVKNARARRGAEMIEDWYKFPVFYFSNHQAISGPYSDVAFPKAGQWLDYEVEIGCVIGKAGRDISAADAESHIAGYFVMNDWSLRDAQRAEMVMNLGPAKGKDFATSIGPYLVTPEELEDKRSGKGFDLAMRCSVNGRVTCENKWSSIYFGFAQLIERASQGVMLYPGDVLGSGTCGRGCLLETGTQFEDGSPIGTGVDGWLGVGDTVEIEIERLGVIRNRIVAG